MSSRAPRLFSAARDPALVVSSRCSEVPQQALEGLPERIVIFPVNEVADVVGAAEARRPSLIGGWWVAQTPAFGSAVFRVVALRLCDLLAFALDRPADRLYARAMSRLRRLVLSDRFFFVTVKLLPKGHPLNTAEFAILARCLNVVRSRQGFRLTAWVFMPDHWHAILYPARPLTISAAMKSIKLSSTNALLRSRRHAGELWQARFFDHALRTVKDYTDTVEIHSSESGSARLGEPVRGLDLVALL